MLDYLKFFKKVQVSVHRLKFLRKCLKNDLIPDFLKFRIPENGFFSDQVVCQSVISGSLTLRNTKIRCFGVKFNFSKIRKELCRKLE